MQFSFTATFFKAKAPHIYTLQHIRERHQIARGTHGKEMLLLCFQSSCQILGNIWNQRLAFYVTRTLKSLIVCSRGKKWVNRVYLKLKLREKERQKILY